MLLIDDPPVPKTRRARDQLLAARALPAKIEELLAAPKARFVAAAAEFEARYANVPWPDLQAMVNVAGQYEAAVAWLREFAASLEVTDHTDAFFRNEVAHRLAGDLQSIAWALRDAASEDVVLDHTHLRRLYRRLIWTFRAEVTSFERKRYASLSHEPNKAMNLNSYIGLMGGSYREADTPTGTVLLPPTGRRRPRRAGHRLRPDARRRQRDPARVLRAPGATCSSRASTARVASRRRPTAPSPARRPARADRRSDAPTCSTSSTRG